MAQGTKFKRKQLKQPDQFISTTDMVFSYLSKHKISLSFIIPALILIVCLGMWFRYNQTNTSLRMEAINFEIEQITASDKIDPEQKINKIENLLKEFSDGPQKQRAILFLANQLYDAHEYNLAISLYQGILKNTASMNLHKQLANLGIAYSLEGNKDFKEAITIYKTIIESQDEFPLFDVYLSLARCYELNNDLNGALLTLREMNIRFSSHPNLTIVQSHIKKLEFKS